MEKDQLKRIADALEEILRLVKKDQEDTATLRRARTMKRIKHRDLTHYFLREHSQLPRAYVASCEKFFRTLNKKVLSNKRQASSVKRRASLE